MQCSIRRAWDGGIRLRYGKQSHTPGSILHSTTTPRTPLPFWFCSHGLAIFLIGIALGTFVYGCAHLGFGFKQNQGFILDCEDVGLVCGFVDLI
jgi:hypothetical protein